MTFVTTVFEPLFKSLIRAKNIPNLPHIIMPGPLDQMPEEEIRKQAMDKLNAIIEALTKDRS